MPETPEKAGPKGGFLKGDDPRRNTTIPGPGRPSDEAKRQWQRLANKGADTLEETGILADPDHKLFEFALRHATEHGYGKAAQTIQGPGGGPIPIQVVNGPGFKPSEEKP